MAEQLRPEHPRPQFVRLSWLNLNGIWEFEYDDANKGTGEKWQDGSRAFTRSIQVPFAFQSKLSGIGDPSYHDVVWYRRELPISEAWRGKRVLLHFGAVDYEATVWVNGELVVRHEGGHTPFSADITDVLRDSDNVVVVRAYDPSTDMTIPRGKQYWKPESYGIFYTRTTGIWQTVWLEAVADVYLEKVQMTPDVDRKAVEIAAFVKGLMDRREVRLRTTVTYQGTPIAEQEHRVLTDEASWTIPIPISEYDTAYWWSPEHPNLFDVAFTLLADGLAVDEAASYFGMRKVSIEDGKFCLNNRPYFLKMVLDQGYYPDGNLTPPSDEAIRRDVELAKEMGFNGIRKHQKLEDPRFLYWCDRLGLAVWSEAANAYEYSHKYVRRFMNEWQESVERDYNHPSILVWVPINESWGIPEVQMNEQQQQHALSMYHLTRSLDSTRLVAGNDGWEMLKTDLFNIHDYEWQQEVLEARYESVDKALKLMPAGRRLLVGEHRYEGQPLLVTEFGGISYQTGERAGWGYSGADSAEDFEKRLRAVVRPLLRSSIVQGYCYTQLTDIEQEINGLLTYDRQPKIPLEIVRAINEGN
ncbi:glycoside hydrolase family 2 protein [Cohnella soli]|uniref:Glycoside hydrolase family 2 protein n=1 Tax=Cohnella soli TaxID=425005 RepID=A0ABW0HUC7_9BACL